MAHKHHKHQQRAGAPMSAEELDRKAHEALAGGRWRQARDHFKLLCKQDREKYLPGLIQANRGLAEELMQKGQISEAEQVLVHLRTLAPEGEFAAVELQGMLRAQNWSDAMQKALQLWKANGETLSEPDRQLVADALVLAFPNVDDGEATKECPEPLRSELTAILGALRCVSEERFEQAQELLRPIPRASIFAAWKTLTKTWIAFYTGARDKAQSLAAMLPAESTPGRAAAPIRALADPKLLAGPQSAARDQAAAGLCRFLDAPEMANLLVQADELWKAGKFVESFHLIRRAKEFPSREPSLAGAVSEFYFRIGFSLREAAQEKYFGALERLDAAGSVKNKAERYLLDRMLACDALTNPFESPEPRWRKFLKHFETDPRHAKLTSLALEEVSVHVAKPAPVMAGFGFGREEREITGAVKLLKESIRLDPGNLSASLKLLDLFDLSKAVSERNRLLDEMTRRFPNDKTVLLKAGTACIERKSFVKGLEYLEKAAQLDPLDPIPREALATGRHRLARQQYEKKQVEKGRAAFAAIQSVPSGERPEFNRGLEFLHARQGLLELLHGDHALGEQLLAQARQEARSLPAMLLFLHGCSRAYVKGGGKGKPQPFLQELSKTVPRNPRERMDLLLTLEYLMEVEDLSWRKETEIVEKLLAPAAKKEFSVKEAAALLPILHGNQQFRKFSKQLVKAGLRQEPKNPRFRIFSILLESAPPLHRLHEFEEAMRDAQRQGDKEIVEFADEPLKALQSFAMPFGNPFDKGDWEEDVLDDEEEPGFAEGLPMEEIDEMRRMAAGLSDEAFAAFRKSSAKIIPLPIFDILIGTRPGIGKKPKKGQEDDHPELF